MPAGIDCCDLPEQLLIVAVIAGKINLTCVNNQYRCVGVVVEQLGVGPLQPFDIITGDRLL